MKTLISIWLLLLAIQSKAITIPSFSSNVYHYGDFELQNIEFTLRYDSRSGGDGSCATCFHKIYKARVGSNGILQFPSITLDPRSVRHDFELKITNKFNKFDNQTIYICHALNSQFKECEQVLSEELKALSAYGFKSQPLEISLQSGRPISAWIREITDMNMQVHVSNKIPQYGDELGWNKQIFGSCRPDMCLIHEGAIVLVGNLGTSPKLYYEITASENPRFSSIIPGIHSVSFSQEWNGMLPAALLNFQVQD
jgi:hypothetical protein